MKNFKQKFFMAIMIVMAMFSQNDAIAQLPQMQDHDFFKVQPDGRYYTPIDDITPSHLDLCTYNSTYTTVQSVDKWGVILQTGAQFKRGQKYDIYYVLFIKDSDTASTNFLKIRRNLNALPGGGNILISQNSDGSGWSKRLSVNLKENDAAYDTINTNDGTWFPAYAGAVFGNGVCKISKITIDSIPGDVNGEYHDMSKVSFECLRYPLGTAPYKGLRCVSGLYVGNLAWDFSTQPSSATKKVSAYFANTSLGSTHVDTNYISVNMGYFPTNYYSETKSKKFSAKVYKTSGKVFLEKKSINPFWHVVDEDGSGQNRIDKVTGPSTILDFYGLSDNTSHIIEWIEDNDGIETVVFTDTVTTLKKAAIVVPKTDPVLNTVSVSDLDSTSAKLNLDITTGNNPGTATVTVKVTVLEDNVKVIYDGNIDIVGTQTPANITKKVPLTGLSAGTEHFYTVKLLTVEKTGNFTTLKSTSGGGGTNSINTINNSDISAYVDPNGFLQTTETQKKLVKQVYNLNGSKLAEFTTKEFDINHLPSGIYFLVVDNKSIKFLK